ncbi:MAG: Fur family transcriptional regulator [Chloroflexota bacterium]|nr:Fur family transcriptional regulator [Chloroflexota bacterium]
MRERGHRLTPQRIMVLQAIEDSDDHISAEEIYAQAHARYPYINISTVYRTLELLKELGLVSETDLGGGRLRYHPVGKARHHHLVCQKCGKVQDVDFSVFQHLQRQLMASYGFDADFNHMAVFGICKDCRD